MGLRAAVASCSNEKSDEQWPSAPSLERPVSLTPGSSGKRSWRLKHRDLELPRNASARAAPAEGRFGLEYYINIGPHHLF